MYNAVWLNCRLCTIFITNCITKYQIHVLLCIKKQPNFLAAWPWVEKTLHCNTSVFCLLHHLQSDRLLDWPRLLCPPMLFGSAQLHEVKMRTIEITHTVRSIIILQIPFMYRGYYHIILFSSTHVKTKCFYTKSNITGGVVIERPLAIWMCNQSTRRHRERMYKYCHIKKCVLPACQEKYCNEFLRLTMKLGTLHG